MSRWTCALATRIGVRAPLVAGPLVSSLGFASFAFPSTGGSYWTTFFPGMIALGVGMGFTVAPLTAAVMGSVERQHAGAASGINNAVARAAGLLALAGLGVLLVTRYNAALDARLATLHLPDAIARAVDAQRGRLADAAPPPDAEPALREALRGAFAEAYVAGFRALMAACAALTALGAVAAAALIDGRREGAR
jgi:Major Facilitator Superfamily